MLPTAAATLFAIALLASGQSASIVATVAGQAVSEGFLRWTISVRAIAMMLTQGLTIDHQPVFRRLITRLLGLIPSMIVAIALGRPGIDSLLVISQVVLSIILPFITFPLLYLTSSKKIMCVKRVRPSIGVASSEDGIMQVSNVCDLEVAEETVDFGNNKFTMAIGWFIWLVIVLANGYVLVLLMMGQGS